MYKKLIQSYSGVFSIFRRYWDLYGSFESLLYSPYFHISILITFFLYPYWSENPWWEMPIGILPNMIGFALGGYAILLSFGDEKFLQFIAEKDEYSDRSVFLVVSATFAHFIVVQITALIVALIAKSTNVDYSKFTWVSELFSWIGAMPEGAIHFISIVFYGFGFLIFIYAIMTGLAATFAIFRFSSWFELHSNSRPKE